MNPILALSKDRRVFIYDQIGGGKSSPTPRKYWNVETFVQELDLLLDHWNLPEVHIGGASWGTTLALEYYLQRGKKKGNVKSLTFLSPMFSAQDWKQDALRLIARLPPKTRKIIRYCHEIEATDSKVYQEAVFAFYLRHVLRSEKKLGKLMRELSETNQHGNRIYEYMWGPSEFAPTGTLKFYNRVNALKKITVPTLFMAGQYDEATPATTLKYSKLVPHSQFEILKDCSHVSLIERPDLVLRKIREFLRKADFF